MEKRKVLDAQGARGIRLKKQDFDNLMASVREAGRIRRGEAKASRTTEFAPVDVKAKESTRGNRKPTQGERQL
jgi:hypothetical protein